MNSQYVKWYREIERNLGSFFRLFGDLCARCAKHTLDQLDKGERKNRHLWCCCMIDNQIHDHWTWVDAVQNKFDQDWYEKLRSGGFNPGRKRMPGNGPCPALGETGCRLEKLRPMTCSTQLCEKMLMVLSRLGLISNYRGGVAQVEDVLGLSDVFARLYGSVKPDNVSAETVSAYLKRLREFKTKFEKLENRPEAVSNVCRDYFEN